MRKNRRNASAETRFRHKLNMLEPGTEMLRWTGILLMVGLALRLIGLDARQRCSITRLQLFWAVHA